MIIKPIYNLKKLLYIAVFISMMTNIWAQQDPLFSQYQFNSLTINPAYAGSKDLMSLMLQSRQQWVGFEGAPSTQTFTAHSPINNKKVGLGLGLVNDKVGPVKQTSLFVDYSYKINITRKTTLAFGLSGGINNFRVDYSNLDISSNDNAYTGENYTKVLPNFGLGLYLSNQNFFFGLSVPKIIENDLDSGSDAEGSVNGKEYRQYYLMSGGIINITEGFKLKPSILTRLSEATPLLTDINLNTIFQDKLWIGAMYRINTAYGANLQFQITPQFRVGYAYEMNTNELKNYNNGTHEIMINFDFNFRKAQVYSPRYL